MQTAIPKVKARRDSRKCGALVFLRPVWNLVLEKQQSSKSKLLDRPLTFILTGGILSSNKPNLYISSSSSK